jgi:hypothetical protein
MKAEALSQRSATQEQVIALPVKLSPPVEK